ncbi:aminopeptidase N [Zymomonas mobilis]|uniref:Aminopeptidase N n=1 Tax=Zymomonas mobilis subsp. pomaceae (strain ATCC 29192 / DSM 22645 / JCM 10191 / CCUG 17912 / NBRC 13757 / NCIMB 11200 / NRRL B-4491 / Barker I) TaxID=579138 RepID=F8ESV0_ZYMMT|nr:aminopeptidase N [Zymomonas mobilis]AEI36916.1 aminopeptidase N [Zymomonas mobilis subsp. pomaceae ATCC 29192]MDX5948289.1 aminopeptidase N [Zymomonas mobilis subsp. pomaceae]GEB89043.1 aminopeptidase N [Zymomonas mobilis subsp. pomaceae]
MSESRVVSDKPTVIHRHDYQPPDWLVPSIALNFLLDPQKTRVKARLHVKRNGEHTHPLRLEGNDQSLISFSIDGVDALSQVEKADHGLTVPLSGDSHFIETEVEISPESNSQLMGLYASSGLLCTQCEAEGFRRITYFPDRPDILSRYTVRMEADASAFPVLLSNGNLALSGKTENGRHFALWNDPFPKPCYLFALVAGNLAARRDEFITASGRKVALAIWVREADLDKTAHAMEALKKAMAWDEKVYGREYDLDQFNIVAVDDFNFGAMENKSLNIFNSRYILADPDTATDADYDAIAGVVAHEYFHNWSGDRVTCRDWFQLSLKEGFTVFRDQSFSADLGSPAVKRIEDVRSLRAAQFPEDAGPLAHPIRPESYIEISNFYTATVYNKGAEIIRMLHRLLGAEQFRKGSDLYFDRHDGEAATCEDFVQAMEDASGVDLKLFRRWYNQAGTPKLKIAFKWDDKTKMAHLHLEQIVPPTPSQPEKQPMVLPVAVALIGKETGRNLIGEQLLVLSEASQDYEFGPLEEEPLLSSNRGFSAPVIIEDQCEAANLAFLSAHDDDPFARYEAMQQLMLNLLVARVHKEQSNASTVVEAVRQTLIDPKLDSAFIAEAVILPSENMIGEQLETVDPKAIAEARDDLRSILGQELEDLWRDAYKRSSRGDYSYTPEAVGARRLRNVALSYLAAGDFKDAPTIAWQQFEKADNMTDRRGALDVLVNGVAPEREQALTAFYERYKDNALVIDKWFSAQALSTRPDTIDIVKKLAVHPDFTLKNPNRARSLIGGFAHNARAFHDLSGEGYRFVTDMIIALDKINSQTAARMIAPFGRWKRYDSTRSELMRQSLEKILETPNLSKDVFEQASKSLLSD